MPVTLIVAVLVLLAFVVASNTCLESALPPHPLLKTRAIIITIKLSFRWVTPFLDDLLKSLLSQTKRAGQYYSRYRETKGPEPRAREVRATYSKEI